MSKPLTANVADSNSPGKDYNLLSLDVFDTCLIQDCIAGIFVALAGGELAARSREDTTLAQVYERLGKA